MSAKGFSRRGFLQRTAGAIAGGIAAPAVVSSRVLGLEGKTPPSDVITRGVIGAGGRGSGFVLKNEPGGPYRTLAVCDVDEGRLKSAVAKAGEPCRGYRDFRDLLDRKDIDVVYIATPPHWHSLISVLAAQSGKDIYCEKPMTRFIREGRAVADAVKRYGRIFHIGTGGRYGERRLRKLVSSGLLGSPLLVRMGRPRYNWKVKEWSGRIDLKPRDPPADLDWNLWLGPAPWKPYHPHRVHGSFRGYWDYDGGGFSDMGAHYLDPVQYVIGADATGPVEIEAEAPWPAHPDAVGLWGRITYRFEDGTVVRCTSGEWGSYESEEGLPFIEGPLGKLHGGTRTDPPDLFDKLSRYPDPPALVEFETALRTRQEPGGNAEASHRVATMLHLGNLAIRLGRKLRWDPVKEEFPNDPEANRWVDPPMRPPWRL
jgi:predicted dehydrogenase